VKRTWKTIFSSVTMEKFTLSEGC